MIEAVVLQTELNRAVTADFRSRMSVCYVRYEREDSDSPTDVRVYTKDTACERCVKECQNKVLRQQKSGLRRGSADRPRCFATSISIIKPKQHN